MNMLFGLNQYNSEFDDGEHPLNAFYIQGFRGSGNRAINPSSSLRRSINNSINEDQQSMSNKASIMSNEFENDELSNCFENFYALTGHSSDVNTVDISSNNELIASGSNDATVRIWKLSEDGTYKENTTDPPFISPITEHSYGVNCVKFSPFSTILATASTDGKIILWSTQTGKDFTLYHPSENAIRCLAFSPNSELLASGSDDETVCIWDIRTRLLLKCLRGPETMITSLIFTNDSLNIIAGSSTGDLWFWQASGLAIGKKLFYVPQAHDLGVLSMDMSNSYQSATSSNDSLIRNYILATCGNDDLIKIWLVKYCQVKSEIKLLNVLKGHESNVNCCRFSSNGDLLVSASGDKSIKLWDIAKGIVIKEHRQHSRFATCVIFSTDDRKIISGSNDKTLIVWEYNKEDDKLKIDLEENDVDEPNDENSILNSEAKKAELKVQNTINNLRTNTNQVSHWSKEQVISWLKSLKLDDCVEIFEANEIDGLELLHLTHDTLQLNLKIESLGKRNKILRAIQSLKNPFWQHLSLLTEENLTLPDELYCPITHEFMTDPVVAFDGYSYERAAIQEWLKKGNNTSPMSNEILISNQVLPNHTLKLLIKKYLAN